MSAAAREAVQPPPLPAALLDPVPMVAVGAMLWLLATIAAFTIDACATWRPA